VRQGRVGSREFRDQQEILARRVTLVHQVLKEILARVALVETRVLQVSQALRVLRASEDSLEPVVRLAVVELQESQVRPVNLVQMAWMEIPALLVLQESPGLTEMLVQQDSLGR